MHGPRRERTQPGGPLRWYDMSEVGLIRHMPGVALAWVMFYALFLVSVFTLAFGSRVDGALRDVVQLAGGLLSLALVFVGWRWLRRGSLAWARWTLVALGAHLGFTLGLPFIMGVSATTVGWAVPGAVLIVVALLGCGVWVRQRARAMGAPAGRFASSGRTPDPPW